MAAIDGKNASVSWICSAGTIALDTDQRNCSYTPSVDFYDQSAGADGNKTYISGAKDGQFSWSALYQGSGTVITNALVEGASGTIVYGPEGTAVGKPKMTFAALSQGASWTQPYNGLVEISCNFQQNGARTDGSF